MHELEQEIRTYLVERQWDHLRPGDLAKSISIEAAELLELFQWDNPSLEEVRANDARLTELKKELADVLIYCLDLSVSLGLDTETIIREKLARAKEKYPAEQFKARAEGQEPGTEDAYWQIKQQHRSTNHD